MNLDNICNDILDEEQNILLQEAVLAGEEVTEALISLTKAFADSMRGVEQTLVKSMQDALEAGADPEKGVAAAPTYTSISDAHAEKLRELADIIED